ncbi:hypothetical protein TNCV_4524281, partial [Trichonephila clavipes]
KISTRHHLGVYDRERVVGRLETGQSVTTVAAETAVMTRLKKVAEDENTLKNPAEGQGRNNTPCRRLLCSLRGKRNRNLLAG